MTTQKFALPAYVCERSGTTVFDALGRVICSTQRVGAMDAYGTVYAADSAQIIAGALNNRLQPAPLHGTVQGEGTCFLTPEPFATLGNVAIDRREHAAVLAGLNLLHAYLGGYAPEPNLIDGVLSCADEVEMLTAEEVDALGERINGEDAPADIPACVIVGDIASGFKAYGPYENVGAAQDDADNEWQDSPACVLEFKQFPDVEQDGVATHMVLLGDPIHGMQAHGPYSRFDADICAENGEDGTRWAMPLNPRPVHAE